VDSYPKNIKGQLRGLANQAHQKELAQLLAELAGKFDEWRGGKIDADRLVYLIHHYDKGPLRELYMQYSNVPEHSLVARAVAAGLLREDDVPADVLPYIQKPLQFYRNIAAENQGPKRS